MKTCTVQAGKKRPVLFLSENACCLRVRHAALVAPIFEPPPSWAQEIERLKLFYPFLKMLTLCSMAIFGRASELELPCCHCSYEAQQGGEGRRERKKFRDVST